MPAERRPERYLGPDYRTALEGGPPAEPLLHADPRRPPRLYRLAVWLLQRLLPLLFRIEVRGLENLPPPPFIIASNHQAWFDPLFIALLLRDQPMVYSMAKRETVFNRGWKRWLVPRFGVFPISPRHGELDLRGVATVYRVLAKGGIVLIFPEGRYSRGRRLLPLKHGVAHFALQSGVPIVPVALEGIDRLRPRGRVRVTVGHPVYPDPPPWWELSRRVARLVESVRRGIQRALGREDGGGAREARLLGRLRARLRRLLRRGGRAAPPLPRGPASAPPDR